MKDQSRPTSAGRAASRLAAAVWIACTAAPAIASHGDGAPLPALSAEEGSLRSFYDGGRLERPQPMLRRPSLHGALFERAKRESRVPDRTESRNSTLKMGSTFAVIFAFAGLFLGGPVGAILGAGVGALLGAILSTIVRAT